MFHRMMISIFSDTVHHRVASGNSINYNGRPMTLDNFIIETE